MESRTIAGIEIIVLEYEMEIPPGEKYMSHFLLGMCSWLLRTSVVFQPRPHLCPLLRKTGMDWEPFIKY